MPAEKSSTLQNDTLSGIVRTVDYFKIDAYHSIDLNAIFRTLSGEKAGCIFKKVLSPKSCKKISENFWKSPSLRQRADGVPAYYVGTYHYKKEMPLYLDEAERTRADVKSLFDNTEDFLENLLTALRAFLSPKGITLRPAEHENRRAGEYLMRSWSDSGKFALEPHDDGAQLKTQLQEGFEISKTLNFTPVAVNICLENGNGGALNYWNYQPDEAARKELGLSETGYPYPIEKLAPFESLRLPIEPGDVYFFNGANVHAVSSLAGETSSRATISFLLGFIDEKTVVYWT